MFTAADQLKFEYAAKLRDEIKELSRELARRGEEDGPADGDGGRRPTGRVVRRRALAPRAGRAAREEGGARVVPGQRSRSGHHKRGHR